MLETEKKSQEYRHLIIKTEEGGGPTLLLHERKIGPEEEAIVVCADESISVGREYQSMNIPGDQEDNALSSEGLPKPSCFLSKAALRRVIRANAI
jgi:hypothetical protein